jgi:DNA-binding response OmpR family regulator
MLVLFVDDDEPVRMTFSALLEESGLQVTEAGSLAEAREKLLGGPYSLVVLDYTLPDGKGTDLLEEVRRFQPAARIAMFTGADLARQPVDLLMLKSEAPQKFVDNLVKLAGA